MLQKLMSKQCLRIAAAAPIQCQAMRVHASERPGVLKKKGTSEEEEESTPTPPRLEFRVYLTYIYNS